MASPSSLPEAALTIETPEAVTTAAEEKKPDKEVAHKTKVIHFLGRTTPIILQNDNGPCPLLAICNVLLIKNQLNLSSDIPEISQEKLLSLVAERLLDSNSNTDNRDAGYVENQQQNIADAIDLLPRLATGIDVNIKFRRIDDFEFTRECAIFDLLDIPLYHGWIVDPQDYDTAIAIGSKSYNTLVEELVALDAQKMETDNKENSEQECVDFAAATTAALGVPSPCLSRGISFDNSPVEELVALDAQKMESDNKVNSEEECVDFAASTTATLGVPSPCLSRGISFDNSPVEELVALDAKKMESDNKENSEEECVDFAASTTAALGVPSPCLSRGISFDNSPVTCLDSQKMRKEYYEEAEVHRVMNLSESEVSTSHNYTAVNDSEPVSLVGTVGENGVDESHNLCSHVASTSNTCNELTDHNFERKGSEIDLQEGVRSSPGTEKESQLVQAISEESKDQFTFPETSANALLNNVCISHESDLGLDEGHANTAAGDANNQKQVASPSEILCTEQMPSHCETVDDSNVPVTAPDSDSSTGRSVGRCETEGFIPSVDPSEPIYEGEESIIESETMANQSKEPMYEGEVVLAEQGFTGCVDDKKEEITPKEGELIRNFLRSSASQLTICGLFRLRDDLKERELCVFFRNNHFNTMFKFEGELYILATDQGFINQPGIVWEKLNEVNGDTVYMTCNFKEFNGENDDNTAWDEQIARASTAEFLANSAQEDMTYDADLKLARDLQQLEFEQHPEQQHPPQHQSTVDGSRLTVGPQVSRIRPVPPNSSKQEAKSSKDKCTVM